MERLVADRSLETPRSGVLNRLLNNLDDWILLAEEVWGLPQAPEDLALNVARTLLDQPRWLQPRFLYDAKGSRLFEEISLLPDYYLTRTEERLLRRHAETVMGQAQVEHIVELGSGSSKKTRHLLSAQQMQRGGGAFFPVDISPSALKATRHMIRRRFPNLEFQGLCASYEPALGSLRCRVPKLIVFLGSSLGNFNAWEFHRFFSSLAASMGRDDYFLLGVDRVKSLPQLKRAYDDSEGLTAEFILNAFRHVESLTGACFDHEALQYRPVYNRRQQRMEMWVSSRSLQRLQFTHPEISWVWRRGESVLVEISRKFDPDRLSEQLRCYGLELVQHHTDDQNWFSLLLFRRAPLGGSALST